MGDSFALGRRQVLKQIRPWHHEVLLPSFSREPPASANRMTHARLRVAAKLQDIQRSPRHFGFYRPSGPLLRSGEDFSSQRAGVMEISGIVTDMVECVLVGCSMDCTRGV